jgi:hypothetical protein
MVYTEIKIHNFGKIIYLFLISPPTYLLSCKKWKWKHIMVDQIGSWESSESPNLMYFN